MCNMTYYYILIIYIYIYTHTYTYFISIIYVEQMLKFAGQRCCTQVDRGEAADIVTRLCPGRIVVLMWKWWNMGHIGQQPQAFEVIQLAVVWVDVCLLEGAFSDETMWSAAHDGGTARKQRSPFLWGCLFWVAKLPGLQCMISMISVWSFYCTTISCPKWEGWKQEVLLARGGTLFQRRRFVKGPSQLLSTPRFGFVWK
jgi:hypothetical protein